MRILYVISVAGIVSALLLWLGFYKILSRKLAALLACVSLAVGGALLLLAVLPGNSFYGHVLYQEPTEKKVIALTFDDGPYPPYTQDLLKLLAEEKVHVTFFLVGENAVKHSDLIRQEMAAGHEIALHSYIHQDQLKLKPEEVRANLERGKAALKQITGKDVQYFRPPHGFKDWLVLDEIQRAGLEAVNWSVIPRDWTNPGADVIAERVISKAHPGAIVLLHDGDSPKYQAPRAQTIAATREIIHQLREQGYEFVTISELKKQAKTNK